MELYISHAFWIVRRARPKLCSKSDIGLILSNTYLCRFYLLVYIRQQLGHITTRLYKVYRTLVTLQPLFITLNKPPPTPYLLQNVALPDPTTTTQSWRQDRRCITYTLQLSSICLQFWRMARGTRACLMVWPTVTGRSKGNCFYNLSRLRLVCYNWTKTTPLVLWKENYVGDV